MNILFICSGNISRSFLAEMLLRHEAEIRKLSNVSVSSAGLYAYPGNPPDPVMVNHLEQQGIPVAPHESKQVRGEDITWADLILVMEQAHARDLEVRWPESKAKTELLGRYISQGRDADDIVDPFGKPPYYYRLAQSQIALALRTLIEKILVSPQEAGNCVTS
jgi:protein-tyrosine phosphatase